MEASDKLITTHRRYLLQIVNDKQERLVLVHQDGTVEFGENYEPDEAARIFWGALAHAAPPAPQCP